jgi:hypothetical protein
MAPKLEMAMKTLSLNLGLALLAMASAACSNSTGPESNDLSILPLDNGNRWIGEFTVYDSAGTILRRGIDTTSLDNGVVNGADRFAMLANHRFVSNGEGGLFIGADQSSTDQWLYMKYPASRDDQIVHSSGNDGGHSVSVKVISTNESITVDAGTFATYHYETNESNNAYVVHTYMAPGVGFVRVELRDRAGDRWNIGSMVWELREVQLAR